MQSTIKVALMENNPIFRKGLSEIISAMEGISIDREIAGIDLHDSDQQQPDLFIVGIDTLEEQKIIEQIKDKWQEAKILVLSAYDHEFNIIRVLQMGANGYLSKRCDKKQLHKAILSVFYTGFYNETLSEKDYTWFGNNKANTPFITENELRFLKLLCSDRSYQDIADKMDMSLHAIEGYGDILFKKLNVNSRVGLVVSAFLMGIELPHSELH